MEARPVETVVQKAQNTSKEKATPESIRQSLRVMDHGEIAVIEFDLIGERANKLTTGIMMRFKDILKELAASKYKIAILVSRKDKIFIAGADIDEIKNITTKEEAIEKCTLGQEIFLQIEALPIPVIAAIHGACMGGGCEMILACDYRLCSDAPETKIGLPEVQLGVIPGFGGTQRLPRVIGLQAALDIILAGKAVDGKKAAKLGLVEKAVPKEILENQAFKLAQDVIAKGGGKRSKHYHAKSLQDKFLESPVGRPLVFKAARKALFKQTKGHYPAPEKALEVIRRTYGGNLKKGLKIEAEGFGEVATTDVSKNLIGLFYMMESVKKATGVMGDVKAREVTSIGVLGAGTMGGGIAQLAADKELSVRIKDLNNDALKRGFDHASELFQKGVKRRKITRYEANRKMGHISGGMDYTGFKKLDVVIEAIVEDINIKKKVIAETARFCKDDAIIASNTSSLSITEMQEAMPRSENFCGMHFFNPVDKMPLIEVIRGTKTSDETAATIFALSKKMGKTPIIVKDGPGFLVNRLLLPYLNEACWILADGASIESIDQALLNFGMPMGPLHLIDEVGIDVGAKVSKVLYKAFGERAKPADVMEKVAATGKLGKKNKNGFYFYDEKGKKLQSDPKLYEIAGLKIPTNPFKEEEIVWRAMFPAINEAAICLEEGIVERAQDVDIGMIMGTGFPAFRGGLLKWADSLGTEKVADELEIMATKFGTRFKASPALRELAKNNTKFYQKYS